MAEVTVNINGRAYAMACADGQERQLAMLAADLDGRVSDIARQYGQVGDARMLVMAALLMADELADARKARDAAEKRAAAAEAALTAETSRAEDEIAEGLETLAARINALAETIERERTADPA